MEEANMTTPTIYVDHLPPPGSRLSLTGTEYHYLVRVLRSAPGDRVRLADARGTMGAGRVEAVTGDDIELEVEAVSSAGERGFELSVIMSGLKRKNTQLVVGKAAELGVAHVVLAPMARTVSKQSPDKVARLRKVAAEAARQVGRPAVPEVELARDLATALARFAEGPCFFLWEQGGSDLRSHDLAAAGRVCMVVGPEGGFAEREVQLLTAGGATPIRFAGPAYKAETAAIAGMALFLFQAGEL